jgi:hypothetical protein
MPKQSKSPFILWEDFIPQNQCEEILINLKHSIPNRNNKNVPIKTIKTNQLDEIRLMPKIDELLDHAEQYYGFKTLNVSPFDYEWRAEGYEAEQPRPDNGMFFNGKWIKSKDVDFTIIVFLSTSKDVSIKDTFLESFGGKLEFFNHKLTIAAKAGTVVMFPSNEHFLNTFSDVTLGNSNCARIQITATTPYDYKAENFPGDYRTWFNTGK